jgi:hypothetical protein
LKFYNPNIFLKGLGLHFEGRLDYNFRQCRKCVSVTLWFHFTNPSEVDYSIAVKFLEPLQEETGMFLPIPVELIIYIPVERLAVIIFHCCTVVNNIKFKQLSKMGEL